MNVNVNVNVHGRFRCLPGPSATIEAMDLWARFRTRRSWRIVGITLALVAVTVSLVAWRSARRRAAAVYARGAGAPDQTTSAETRPVSEWTDRFTSLLAARDWETLDAELEGIREREPDLYAWYRLGYLHGRVKLALGEHAESRRMLDPFLAAGHPLRDLALHYAATGEAAAGNAEEAARLREDLIVNHRQGNYRQRALEDHVEWLTAQKDLARLRGLMGRLSSEDAAAVRDIESRIVVLSLDTDRAGAVAAGMRLLKANQGDDAAERVARALDRPEILDTLPPADWILLGESARSHRHYDRAVVLLERALQAGRGSAPTSCIRSDAPTSAPSSTRRRRSATSRAPPSRPRRRCAATSSTTRPAARSSPATTRARSGTSPTPSRRARRRRALRPR